MASSKTLHTQISEQISTEPYTNYLYFVFFFFRMTLRVFLIRRILLAELWASKFIHVFQWKTDR